MTDSSQTVEVQLLTDEQIATLDTDSLVAANQNFMNTRDFLGEQQAKLKMEIDRRHFEEVHAGMPEAEENALINKLAAEGKIQIIAPAGINKPAATAVV